MATLAVGLGIAWAPAAFWESGIVISGGSRTTAAPAHRVPDRVTGLLPAPTERAGDTGLDETRLDEPAGDDMLGDGQASEADGPDEASERVRLGDVVVEWEQVARAVVPITGALHPRSGEVWIGEQDGAIRVLQAGGLSEPVLDLRHRTEAEGERGLLGMAFGPEGQRLFVHFSDDAGDTQIVEFDLEALEAGEPGDGRTVLSVDQPRGNHNGGDIIFGPDEFLYVALGDGGGLGDRQGHAQNKENLLGAVLRIDPLSAEPYAVPLSNPFVDDPAARPEIWAYGLRNPFRMAFDDDGSLWIGDVGQGEWEEIDRIPPGVTGANLGWNLVEGHEPFSGSIDGIADYLAPVHVYSIDGEPCAVIGGRVYRGSAIGDLVGSYLYSDFCEQSLRAFEADDSATDRSLDISVPGGATAFVEDADREILALSQGGDILRLVPADR